MDTRQAKELIQKYVDGECTAQEKAVFESWYNQHIQDRPEPTIEPNYKVLQRRLEISLPAGGNTKQLRLWPRIAVAAAALAAITIGAWLYTSSIGSRHPMESRDLLVNDIAPGKNTATLTLADGKVINLDTNRTSVIITDSVKAMTMLTASTPRGGTYQITLPDGSHVWLNADSKISFPSQFIGKSRKIQLTGEAYLEVAKDKAHPFIVESTGQQVEVLGTHFNINSYAEDGSTKTTLLEGAVRVSSLRSTSRDHEKMDEVMLKPGQQSVLTDNNYIKVEHVDLEEAVAWKNGVFIFNDEEIEHVMRRLSRWYDIDVIYKGKINDERYFGEISRFKNLSQVLGMLERTNAIHFKIEGRRVTVMK